MLQFVATMTRSATAPEHAHLFFIFSLLSGFFWTCAYALAIRNGFKYKTYCIPAPAVCMNLAWELLGALELSGYAPVWVWLCRLAVILDTVIFLTVILYGARSQGPWLGHETIFRALMVLGFLITFGVQYLHVHSLHGYLQYLPSDSELMRKIGDVLQANDDLPGHIKATLARIQSMAGTYVINLLMSLMFLTWLFAQRKPFERGMEGQFGLGVAVFKMLGTAITLVPVMMLDGRIFTHDMKTYLISMATLCVAVDVAYVILVAMMQVGVPISKAMTNLVPKKKETLAAGQP